MSAEPIGATALAPPRPARAGGAPPGRRHRIRGESLTGYAFVAPNLVLLGVFVLVPLIWAIGISFQRTDGFGAGVFIGLGNYARLLSDPELRRRLGRAARARHAAEFTWEHVAGQYEDLLVKAAGARRTGGRRGAGAPAVKEMELT